MVTFFRLLIHPVGFCVLVALAGFILLNTLSIEVLLGGIFVVTVAVLVGWVISYIRGCYQRGLRDE